MAGTPASPAGQSVPMRIQGASDLRSSVVKVFVRSVGPNFVSPWAKRPQGSGTGSGLCVRVRGNERYILTNSHVIANAVSVRVRKHGTPTRYPAIVRCVSPQCDLALLEVEPTEFWSGISHIDLTEEVPELDSRVVAVGYPMGGDNISVTRGVVSRVDLMDYTFSPVGGERLPVIQVDAAINPGNSGGPVLAQSGKAVGVAFAGLSAGENIGYVIPGSVALFFIHNFVQTGGSLTGLCSLGVRVQSTQSQWLRRLYGLTSREGDEAPNVQHEQLTQHGGVLVVAIAPMSPAAQAGVQPGDILLAIDGVPIGEDSTVPFRGPESNERIGFDFLVTRKVKGERLVIEYLASQHRRVEASEEAPPTTGTAGGSSSSRSSPADDSQICSADVTCGTVPKLVSRLAGVDANPSYFIVGGLVFVPLSLPWLLQRFPRGLGEAPGHLLQKLDNFKDHEEEEIVVLAKVLASEVNYGYEDFQCMQLLEIGSFAEGSFGEAGMVKVRSLRHLRDFVTSAMSAPGSAAGEKKAKPGGCLRFMLFGNFEVVLDVNACKAVSAEILSQHAIPSECSANLLTQEVSTPSKL